MLLLGYLLLSFFFEFYRSSNMKTLLVIFIGALAFSSIFRTSLASSFQDKVNARHSQIEAMVN